MLMTRGSVLGQDPSGMRFVLAWNFRGAWSARCRCLPRIVCRIRVQTSWPARALCSHLPLNRQGKAAAAHPRACFSKAGSRTAACTPLRRLWGSKAYTQACTRTHTHAYAQAYRHTYTHAQVHTHICTHALHRQRVMGFANFSALLTTLPHLSSSSFTN